MKISDLHKLKEIVLAHKQDYATKDQGKKLWYQNYKKEILGRIEMIDQLEIKKKRFLADIDEYLAGMEKKLKIILLPPEVEEVKKKEEEGKEGSKVI